MVMMVFYLFSLFRLEIVVVTLPIYRIYRPVTRNLKSVRLSQADDIVVLGVRESSLSFHDVHFLISVRGRRVLRWRCTIFFSEVSSIWDLSQNLIWRKIKLLPDEKSNGLGTQRESSCKKK